MIDALEPVTGSAQTGRAGTHTVADVEPEPTVAADGDSDDADSASGGDEAGTTEPGSTSADEGGSDESGTADSSDTEPGADDSRTAEAETVDPAPIEPAIVDPQTLTDGTGQVSGLTLTVIADGTANSDGSWDATDDPGQDSSATNGIVRTHDTVVYRWGYSVAEAGDITMTQTLPEGMSWVVSESTAVCSEGTDAVSADGRTLSCTQANQATGAATYLVRATVNYGTQGQELSTVLSAAGTADSAPATVTVSAAPELNLRVNNWANGFTLGGESGAEYGQSVHVWVYVYQTVDAVRGVRGSEGLTDSFSFTVDPSDMGEGAIPQTCITSPGTSSINTKITGGTSTAANSVPDAGTWSCAQAEPGGPITVTVTGAITDLRSYPTQTTSGSAVTGRAYATFGQITLWIPNEDYPAARKMTVRLRDFDPDSASGQSNYGDDYAPGQEPDSAAIAGTNATSFTFAANTEDALVTSLSRVYAADGGLIGYDTPRPSGTTSTSSGMAPMNTGETLRFGGSIKGTSPWGTAYTDVGLCAVWDEALLSGGVPELGYGSSDIELTGVEYAHLDVSTDAERRSVDCGSSGDGATEWSSSYEDAGGDGVVNAVRFTIPELPFKEVRYLAVPMTRTDLEVDAGTPLALFWQVRSAISDRVESTFDPTTQTSSTLGARAVSADGEVSAELSWANAVSAPGSTQTVTVQPVVTGTAQDASVAVTLPAGVTVVAGSWPAQYTPTVAENDDGSFVYTFDLGDLTEDEEPDPLTFDVTISARLEMPATLTATAVISSSSDPREDSYRTASGLTTVNATTGFNALLAASSVYAISGVPLTYTLTWVNGLDDSQGVGSFVVLLPFEGDSRGTIGTSEPLTVNSIQVSADMDVTVQYTTDAAADVETALSTDRSGDTGITWLAEGEDADISTATAVRFVTGEIAGHTSGEAAITVTPGAQLRTAELVTDLSGTVSGLATALAGVSTTRVSSGNTGMTGVVYQDVDYAWQVTGTSVPLAGVQVRVTGRGFGENGGDDGGSGDDIVIDDDNAIIGTTDEDGQYTIDGLVPGEWTVTVDESTLPDLDTAVVAAEVPDERIVLTPAEERSDVNFGYIIPLDPPVLSDSSHRLAPDTTVTLTLPDDLDPSVSITGTTDPDLGAVTVADSGLSLTYAAGPMPGTTSFTYTVTDAARQTATATVSIEVVAPPTATGTELVVGQGPTVIDLADLFTGDDPTPSISTGPEHGTATLSGPLVTYQPGGEYAGDDSFVFTVTDSLGQTDSATVRLVVLAAPVAGDGAVWTITGRPVAISLADFGVVLDGVSVAIITGPQNGQVEQVAAGVLTYTPADGWTGTDSLVYRVTDEAGQQATGTVNVRVVPAVVVQPDAARTAMGAPVELNVLANDTAEEGAVTDLAQPEHGTAEILDASAGTIRYTPADGFAGIEAFSYTVTDAVGQNAVGIVTVTVVAAPVAEDVNLRVAADASAQVDLAARATGEDLTGTVSAPASHGTFTLDGGGIATYQPEPGYLGTDTAVVIWTDSVAQTTTQTVAIVVFSGPIVPDSAYSTGATLPLTIDLLAGASAATTLTVTQVSDPVNGTLAIDGSSAVYTAAADDFSGTDSFTVTATDEDGLVATGTVTITVIGAPDAPSVATRTAVDSPVTLRPLDDPGTIPFSIPASSTASSAATITAVTQPELGSVELAADGLSLVFTPQAGVAGTSTFTYTVTDDLGQSVDGSIEIRVVALTATDIAIDATVSSQITIDVLDSVVGENLQIESTTTPLYGTVEVLDGRLVYTAGGARGSDVFMVAVMDDLGQLVTVTVRVELVEAVVESPGSQETTGDGGASDSAASGTEATGGSDGTGGGTGGTGSSGGSGGRLAITGGDALGMLLLGIALTGVGWRLAVLRRRRPGGR